MAIAWLAYVPIPGLSSLAVWLAPDDVLTRYHARQGLLLVAGLYATLLVAGLLARLSDAAAYLATLGLLAGLLLVATVVGLVWGAIGAARGRFVRVRPAWDLLGALGA